MLLLDYNEDRSLHSVPYKYKGSNYSTDTLNFGIDTDIQEVSAKIYINTLSPSVGFGGGRYQMSVVKRMSAKADFLKMPLKDRNCEVESYEDCRTRKLLEACKCAPWEVPGFEVEFHDSRR